MERKAKKAMTEQPTKIVLYFDENIRPVAANIIWPKEIDITLQSILDKISKNE